MAQKYGFTVWQPAAGHAHLLLQQRGHFFVCDLGEVAVELSNGLEVVRGVQTNHFVDHWAYVFQCLVRRHGDGTNQFERMAITQAMQRA
jgi:hypothetical protein